MSRARFRVSLDRPDFNKAKTATVVVSRTSRVFSVRPYRQHKTYSLPLADVALMVMWRCIQAEVAATKAEKLKNKPPKKYLAKRGLL